MTAKTIPLGQGKGLKINGEVFTVYFSRANEDCDTIIVKMDGSHQRLSVNVPTGMGFPLMGKRIDVILAVSEDTTPPTPVTNNVVTSNHPSPFVKWHDDDEEEEELDDEGRGDYYDDDDD